MDQLRFKNHQFKIMQIADAQELPLVSPDTVTLIEMALAAEQPDLVVFTGDQIYGIDPHIWGKNAEARITAVFSKLLAPVIEAGVPFAVTFGNHDAECGVPNARQAEIYASFPGCITEGRMSNAVPGAMRLPIYGAAGAPAFDLFLFDSRGSAAAGGRGVSDQQLQWFEALRAEERETQKEAPFALVFQHIPVPEYYNVIKEVKKGTRGAAKTYGKNKGRYYALPDEIRAAGGFMKEVPAVAGEAEFAVLQKDCRVLAIAAGHDHINSFVAPYKGIDLIYTQGAGFHVYGPDLKRGVRIFTLDENAPGAYTTYTRTWESLTHRLPKEAPLAWALSHTPTSVAQAKEWIKRAAILGAAGAAVTAGAAWTAVSSAKKRK